MRGPLAPSPTTTDPRPGGATIMNRPTFLVFDTETTGLPPRAPRGTPPIAADDPRQPRMASFAAIVADQHGREITRHKHYVHPDGWSIDGTGAGKINGLTDEFLRRNGVEVSEVLEFYSQQIGNGLIAVAFNKVFDLKIMRGELRRAGLPDLFEQTKAICCMNALDPYAAEGLCMSRPGSVKLPVACEFFGIPLENAHDAMADAEGARAILEILIRDRRCPEPSVTYSKYRAA
ncbi:exonuclease domain-containing protein [Paracoccus sp. KR1-242]|uniref:3'-5' exonuclease n=1 Tax=Paracoccus sp. KR1-242 TaxID=3410028 RepID=UPI003C124071